jgi:hypothetical protein
LQTQICTKLHKLGFCHMQCTVGDFAAIGGELICIGRSDGQILPVAETSIINMPEVYGGAVATA